MTLKLNGVDFMPYLGEDGVELNKRRVVGNQIVTLDGLTHRGVQADKTDMRINLRVITDEERHDITEVLKADVIQVTYIDGGTSFYANMFTDVFQTSALIPGWWRESAIDLTEF